MRSFQIRTCLWLIVVLFVFAASPIFAGDREDSIEKQVQNARDLVNKGQYSEAEKLCTKIIQQDQKNVKAYSLRGYANDKLGKRENAVRDYSMSIDLDPGRAVDYNNRGATYGDLGKYDLAKADLNKAIELDPKLATAYYNRAKIYEKTNQKELALNDYRTAAELGDVRAQKYLEPKRAKTSKKPNYFALKGGVYSPQNNLEILGFDTNKKFDTGFTGEIALGHYFDKFWALELGTGYFETRANTGIPVGPFVFPWSVDLRVVPLTIALKGIIPIGVVELYGIGGIGSYFLWSDVNATLSNGSRHSVSDSEELFGSFLGIGVQFNVTPDVFVGLEGRYLWTTSSDFNEVGILGTNLNGAQATFNIGFRF